MTTSKPFHGTFKLVGQSVRVFKGIDGQHSHLKFIDTCRYYEDVVSFHI